LTYKVKAKNASGGQRARGPLEPRLPDALPRARRHGETPERRQPRAI